MSKRAVVIGRDNGYGTSYDCEVMVNSLQHSGYHATWAQPRSRSWWQSITARASFDLAVHVERCHPNWYSAARQHVLIPNQERFPRRHVRRLRRIDVVLAKTHHAAEIFSALGKVCRYVGFTSPDRHLEEDGREWYRFLHLAGGNNLRGTERLIRLWSTRPDWPELLVVQRKPTKGNMPKNIRMLSGYLEEAKLRALQNQCGIHLVPSLAEGWGHNILETMSCGALAVTVNAPPMNEHIDDSCGMLVEYARCEPRHLGVMYYFDNQDMERAVDELIAMEPSKLQYKGAAARTRYFEICSNFTREIKRIDEFLAPAAANGGAAQGGEHRAAR